MKYIVLCIIIAVLILIIFLIKLLKNRKEVNYDNEANDNESKYNQSDINMMNNLNQHGFSAKKVSSSKIEIPDFNKSKPIGFIDKNNSSNTYGDKISNNHLK